MAREITFLCNLWDKIPHEYTLILLFPWWFQYLQAWFFAKLVHCHYLLHFQLIIIVLTKPYDYFNILLPQYFYYLPVLMTFWPDLWSYYHSSESSYECSMHSLVPRTQEIVLVPQRWRMDRLTFYTLLRLLLIFRLFYNCFILISICWPYYLKRTYYKLLFSFQLFYIILSLEVYESFKKFIFERVL